MTPEISHNTDCEVRVDYREDLDEISDLIYDSDESAERRAEEMGWEYIGGGMGRQVWRVSPANQEGPRETVMHDQPCVVKFAVPSRHDGLRQNNEEINQFERFPPEVTEGVDGDVPAVVPLKDWADDRQSWVSMPEVDPNGGYAREAEDKLLRQGWKCNDIHPDNVGAIQGESVILDYGLDCFETQTAAEFADDLAGEIESEGGEEVEVKKHDDFNADIYFYTPDWFGDADGRPDKSTVSVVRDEGPRSMRFAFGPWKESRKETLEESVEGIADDIETGWREAVVRPFVDQGDDGIEVVFDIELQMPPDAVWDEWMFGNFYEYALEAVEEGVIQGRNPDDFVDDVKRAFNDRNAPDIDYRGRGPTPDGKRLLFAPAPADAPGFDRPGLDSWVHHTGAFHELRVVVGPWRADEPQEALLGPSADDAVDIISSKYPAMDVIWRRYNDNVDGVKGGAVEISFSVASNDDNEDSDNVEPDEVVEMYEAVIGAINDTMPTAVSPSAPTQRDIGEFIDGKINAAIASAGLQPKLGGTAICPTGDRCETQAESLAADLYDHVHNDYEVTQQRVNGDIRDMINRNFTPPSGEQVVLRNGGSEIALVTKDETLETWNYWGDVVKAATAAPDDKGDFIRTVKGDVLDMAEEALGEAQAAV